MDRQADLSRLRYLLVELTEQLEVDAFDPVEWKQITLIYQEVNQLCERLGRLPVVVIEGDWLKSGRLTAWRPEGPPPILVDIRATKSKPFDTSLWSALRQPEVTANLRRWVRFVDQMTADEPHGDGWSEMSALLSDMSKVSARVFRVAWDHRSISLSDLASKAWPDEDGGVSLDTARKTVNRLITWLCDRGRPDLITLERSTVKTDRTKIGQV